MSTVAVTRLVVAPIHDVWRVFSDLSGRASLLSTVESVEVLTAQPFGPGTRWREIRTLSGGLQVGEEYVVDQVEAPRLCAVSSPGVGANYRLTFRFSEIKVGRHAGCTSVTAVQEGGPTATYGRLLALMFGGLAARTVEGALRRDLADLATAVERGRRGDPATAA
ncbi:SRPBCC family protein [Plantactinospora sp. GCM10030261]|uniref:SRPBCC family protein n=1 Tax=Plantactinospora sp. GCM10030261 TaxID=3273420 RepID=UPI0036226753